MLRAQDRLAQSAKVFLVDGFQALFLFVGPFQLRSDGRGAVFLLDSRDVAEAQAIIDDLPLAKQNLMDHEYIAVGPLLPLRLFMANP